MKTNFSTKYISIFNSSFNLFVKDIFIYLYLIRKFHLISLRMPQKFDEQIFENSNCALIFFYVLY